MSADNKKEVSAGAGEEICNTVIEYRLPMRDGVELYTVLQLPAATGKFPLIIIRSPYYAQDHNLESLKKNDTHGYAYLIQDCRGTANSAGECNPYLYERNDGLDTLEWVRQQPFYNGEIFLYGGSYLSSVHFSYLDTDPADIKAAFLPVQDSERYNICYRHGFCKFGLHGSWVMKMHNKNREIRREFSEDTFRTLPWKGVTEAIFGEYVPYIEESFLHPDPEDPYWQTAEGGADYRNACGKCSIPILLATSFYDIYTEGVFDMWRALSPERRRNCALLVSPFDHGWNPKVENLPPETQEFQDGVVSRIVPDIALAWFDHFRCGTPLPFIRKGETTYYRLWDNSWHHCEELVNAPGETVLFLAPDRTLQEQPAAPGSITYTYNPYAPASFPGGVCNNFGGMKYQDPPNSRYDIISFLSAPLEKEMICEGGIEVELHVSSTAEDTCFYTRLNFERDGKTLSLRDDIDSLCRLEKEYTPGEERVLKFRFAPHAFKLRPGDRVRLDVSSSCFPHFQPHTNCKGIQAEQKNARICRNTVITEKSFIKLYTL